MNATANQSPRRRWLLWLVVAVALAFGLFVVITSLRIVHEADKEELHAADAIVVFGAAEYAGRPSPVYRARLDHAYELFERGLAPIGTATFMHLPRDGHVAVTEATEHWPSMQATVQT